MRTHEKASEEKHKSSLDDIRRSYDGELLRLQTLLTKSQVVRAMALLLFHLTFSKEEFSSGNLLAYKLLYLLNLCREAYAFFKTLTIQAKSQFHTLYET